MKRIVGLIALCAASVWTASILAQELKLPNIKDSFRFAVIGDTGTGGPDEYKVAEQMVKLHKVLRYDVVAMMGDNMYGGESPKDFQQKFELPYGALLKDNVKFYASLGNHDNSNQRFYKNFNMDGKRYYSFKPHDGVRFFALDSNYMDKEQIVWLDKELGGPDSDWKIVFFHHPLYSDGDAHGSATELRNILEPIFLKHNVSLVLAGHEHFYERIVPQHGIPYFIVGSSAKLRKGNITKTDLTAKGFDTDNVFMACEIDKDTLTFQVIAKTGMTIDSGTIQRPTTQVQPLR
ncbi:MAG: metallophosphoesterase [Acidobacteriota bacterium]